MRNRPLGQILRPIVAHESKCLPTPGIVAPKLVKINSSYIVSNAQLWTIGLIYSTGVCVESLVWQRGRQAGAG